MKKIIAVLIATIILNTLVAQPNCNWYKYQGDTKKYEACVAAEKREGHYQFSSEYQKALDDAILIDSTWAFPYSAKSTAYLKSGDFITWMKLMDKAVQYDSIDGLEYRGWCRFQFFHDYQGAIEDLVLLKDLTNNRVGYSVNGNYHLDIALGLCYTYINEIDTAISIMLNKLSDTTYTSGLFDHLHLGVLLLEKGDFVRAIEQFKLQEMRNDLAENRFYIAIAYKFLNDEENYLANLNASRMYYQRNQKMFDLYTEPIDKIYMSDIIEEEDKGYLEDKPSGKGFVLRGKRKE